MLAKTTAHIEATKSFNNWGKADSFTFRLTGVGNAPMPAGTTGNIVEQNATQTKPTVNFGNITFDSTGDYTYEVQEIAPETKVEGVTYDETVHTVTIRVSADPNSNGDLEATVDYGNGAESLTITNTYAGKTTAHIEATKSFNNWGKADSFTFRLTGKNGAPMPVNATENKVELNATQNQPTVSFGNITFDKEGDYEYTVQEIVPETKVEGVTYDETVHTVTIHVTADPDSDGDLVATVDYGPGVDSLTITNTYISSVSVSKVDVTNDKELAGARIQILEGDEVVAEWVSTEEAHEVEGLKIGVIYTLHEVTAPFGYDITADTTFTIDEDGTVRALTATQNSDGVLLVKDRLLKGEITFAGVKTIEGRERDHLDVYTFEIYETKDGASSLVASATNFGTGEIKYPTIHYTAADIGEHVYTVKESATSRQGITIDGTTYTVTVTVSDDHNGDGKLVVTASDNAKALNFVNTYEAKEAITFEGQKSIQGRDLTAEDIFTFEVKDNETGSVWTVRNDGTGKILYPTISYVKNKDRDDTGVHTYTIRETSEDGNGLKKDTNTYTVTVTVTDPDNNGRLKVVASDDAKKLDFINTYDAGGSTTFSGTKSIDNRELKSSDIFTFEIREEGTDNVWTAQNNVHGVIGYPTITYVKNKDRDDTGLHTYTVTERKVDEKGITSDTGSYTVTVEVTDRGDGFLTATPSNNFDKLNFKNHYEANGQITFEGTKTLKGREMEEGDVFNFLISEGTNRWTATSNAEGKILYPTITYDIHDVGTHTYVIVESSSDAKGITTSKESYVVTVSVSDNGDGSLKVIAGEKAKKLNFVNTYEAEGAITFEGRKSINGRAWTPADIYSFEVKDNGTGETWSIRNDADGKILYPTISYIRNETRDDTGIHTYTVRETSAGGNGITPSTEEYTVTVTVTDNKDGTLKAVGDEKAKKLDFINTYDADGDIVLTAVKVLHGRDMKDNEFTFELRNEAGELIDTASARANGTITFQPIHFELADMAGAPYHFTISEVQGEDESILYDPKTENITVSISDNGDGTLNVTADKQGSAVTFTNEYQTSGLVVRKSVTSNTAADHRKDFSFTVTLTPAANFTGIQTFGEMIFNDGVASFTLRDGEQKAARDLPVGTRYVVAETGEEGFTTTSTNASGRIGTTFSEVDFVNSRKEGGLTVSKTVVGGKDPEKEFAFTVTLTDETISGNYGEMLFTEGVASFALKDGETRTAEGLPAGIGYTVNEEAYPGYETTTEGAEGTIAENETAEAAFTNTYSYAPTAFTPEVTKALTNGDGNWPEEGFTFDLAQDTEQTGVTLGTVSATATEEAKTVTFPEITFAEEGIFTFTITERVPEDADENHIKDYITYDPEPKTLTVTVEDNLEGQLVVTSALYGEAESLTVTNIYRPTGELILGKLFDFHYDIPEPETGEIDIPVTKIWADHNNRDGNRPAAITVRLYADGAEVRSAVISAAEGWRYTFRALPRNTVAGVPIRYTISEDPVEWYRSSIEGFTITNLYTPETTEVVVSKVWNDNGNADGMRPAGIYCRLSNGQSVVLTAENNWTATVSGLPTRVNGQPVTYTWTEQEVLLYEQTGVTTNGNATTFTNTYHRRPEEKKDETPKPPTRGNPLYVFEDYETPLGVDVVINHVGDCFE